MRRRVLIGTYVLSAGYYDAYYLKAQKVRTLIKRDFDEAYEKVDVLLTPTTPGAAFGIGEVGRSSADVPQRHLHRDGEHGGPARHLGAGRLSSEGPPLGLQLIGKPFDEETLFRAAQAIEDAAGRFRCRTNGGGRKHPRPNASLEARANDPARTQGLPRHGRGPCRDRPGRNALVDVIAERLGYVERAWQIKLAEKAADNVHGATSR